MIKEKPLLTKWKTFDVGIERSNIIKEGRGGDFLFTQLMALYLEHYARDSQHGRWFWVTDNDVYLQGKEDSGGWGGSFEDCQKEETEIKDGLSSVYDLLREGNEAIAWISPRESYQSPYDVINIFTVVGEEEKGLLVRADYWLTQKSLSLEERLAWLGIEGRDYKDIAESPVCLNKRGLDRRLNEFKNRGVIRESREDVGAIMFGVKMIACWLENELTRGLSSGYLEQELDEMMKNLLKNHFKSTGREDEWNQIVAKGYILSAHGMTMIGQGVNEFEQGVMTMNYQERDMCPYCGIKLENGNCSKCSYKDD